MTRSFFLLLGLVASFVSASAEMVFDNKLIVLKVGVDDDEVLGEFPFEIKGSDTVLKNYDAACACLAARIEPLLPDRSTKMKWKVGETGKVIAKFSLGNIKGEVDKAIVLNFSSGEPAAQLVVRVQVPELFKVEPMTHHWNLGDKFSEKVYKITVNHTEPINITSHSGTNKNFPYEVITIKEGWEYQIKVKPLPMDRPGMGLIRIRTDSESKRFKRSQIFGVVRTPKPGIAKAGQ